MLADAPCQFDMICT